jgi:Flp pilus assembly protein TadD
MMSLTIDGCSDRRIPICARRTRKALFIMGALLSILSAASLFAQINSAQLIDRNPSGPSTVSRNQLLAPGKAQRGVERAQKEIIAGHFESAKNELARVLRVAPHYAVAKVLLGAIAVESKDFVGAATSFQQAINDDPGLGAAYVGMAVVMMRQGQFQASLPVLDRAEGLLPEDWFVRFAKGWAHLELGNTADAVKQAACAEQMAGTDSNKRAGVSYLRAMIYIRMNDFQTAREQLASAAAGTPDGEYTALAQAQLGRLQPLLTAMR